MAPKQQGRKGGKGRGKGKSGARKPQRQVEKKARSDFVAPVDFKVNENKRYNGQCVYFNRRGGFGFIQPNDDGVVPNNKVMVYWKEIKSDDRWPFLHKGLEVEFGLTRYEKANGKGAYIKAKSVSGPKGSKINLQDVVESKMEYVHSKVTRFTGVCKFYNVARGAGVVTLDDGYAGVDDVPSDLRIVRNEIQSGEEAPTLRNGLKVEFGIQKNAAGKYSCYNLSMPGGHNVSRVEVEERKNAGSSSFNGEIIFFDFRKSFGYIKPENISKLPANIKKSLDEGVESQKARLNKKGLDKKAAKVEPLIYFRKGDVSSSGRVSRGNQCSFKLYLDNRGCGACDVNVKA
jgi:cold shock CspA family protein